MPTTCVLVKARLAANPESMLIIRVKPNCAKPNCRDVVNETNAQLTIANAKNAIANCNTRLSLRGTSKALQQLNAMRLHTTPPPTIAQVAPTPALLRPIILTDAQIPATTKVNSMIARIDHCRVESTSDLVKICQRDELCRAIERSQAPNVNEAIGQIGQRVSELSP